MCLQLLATYTEASIGATRANEWVNFSLIGAEQWCDNDIVNFVNHDKQTNKQILASFLLLKIFI